MRLKAYFIILVTLSLIPAMNGKTQPPDADLILEDLFTGIINTRNDAERIRLNDSISLIIDSYVASNVRFTHRFNNLRYLGQILSPDSRIKIITWNLILTDGTNRYFCYLIKKGEKGMKNQIYKLTGVNMDEAPRTDLTYSADNWYGALYYDIQPFRIGKKTHYILLGLDYGNLLESRKIIDVLSFSDDGGIIFGKECFIKGNETKFREILEYSSDGVVTLRFHDKKSVIFDHLAPLSSGQQENRKHYGSEFSFDAYILNKGLWRFIRNIEVKNRR